MFKSSVTTTLYENFVSSYQKLEHSSADRNPFVYVDIDGSVKLLTSFVNNDDGDDDVFGVSMAEDGWMEILSLS